jgi:hypothetical protein
MCDMDEYNMNVFCIFCTVHLYMVSHLILHNQGRFYYKVRDPFIMTNLLLDFD